MKRETNIFDKIGTLIPGYRGYQEREGRRECDRQLREQIAGRLTYVEKDLNLLIENIPFEKLSEIEKFRKKINSLNDLIKYSVYGASSFFSNSVIKETELENIYQYDLEILEVTNELQGITKLKNLSAIKENIELLEKAIIKRNQYLKEI